MTCWFSLIDRLAPLGTLRPIESATSQAWAAPQIAPHGDRQIIIGQLTSYESAGGPFEAHIINSFVQVGRAISWIAPAFGVEAADPSVLTNKVLAAAASRLEDESSGRRFEARVSPAPQQNVVMSPTPLWAPTPESIARSNIGRFIAWLAERGIGPFDSYDDLWRWSVDDLAGFWEAVWLFFDVQASRPYETILDSATMPGTKWLQGAELNYAEHILRHRERIRRSSATPSHDRRRR